MKHWIALSAIVALGLAAIVVGERRKVDAPVGPNALLYLVADTEQELTRMPVSFTRMSDEEEIQVGNNLADAYRDQNAPSEETKIIQADVQEVGTRLALHAHRRLPYTFHYLPDQNLINAFALPGGHVYIGQGLLALMDSEDELAAVLGHEIEHIDHYHCAERVQQEQALRKIPFGELMSLPMELFEAGYSKDQELEADREGTRLAVATGYSANGAVRMFEVFERLYEQIYQRSQSPGGELSQVAEQTLEGYFRSHPLPSERVAQIQSLIASEHWELRAERDLAVAYIFQGIKAQEALAGHRYSEAQRLATLSLRSHPGQPKTLETLAGAQFAQADFAGAAASYRKILEIDPTRLPIENAYAQSLAAADRTTALAVFRQWSDALPGAKPQDLQVPLAGLSLLAGDPAPTRAAEALARINEGENWGLDWLADLAWWHYLAGAPQTAQSLIVEAVQQRPGRLDYATALAWFQIDQHRYGDALQNLNQSGDNTPDRTMAEAVAFWLGREPDAALRDFANASAGQPEWKNPRWVKALYSPLVASAIDQMQAEQQRRQKAAPQQH